MSLAYIDLADRSIVFFIIIFRQENVTKTLSQRSNCDRENRDFARVVARSLIFFVHLHLDVERWTNELNPGGLWVEPDHCCRRQDLLPRQWSVPLILHSVQFAITVERPKCRGERRKWRAQAMAKDRWMHFCICIAPPSGARGSYDVEEVLNASSSCRYGIPIFPLFLFSFFVQLHVSTELLRWIRCKVQNSFE